MCMATITMTLEHYNAIVDELLNGLKSSEKEIAKELSALKTKKIYEDAKRAYSQIINNWYNSYSPLYYNRLYSLKSAADITMLDEHTIDIYLNEDHLGGHHLNNAGLYNLTMRQGYHGGSKYRGPLNKWSHETRPAVKTFSPVRAMQNWAKSYSSPHEKEKHVVQIVKKYLSKYELFRLHYGTR